MYNVFGKSSRSKTIRSKLLIKTKEIGHFVHTNNLLPITTETLHGRNSSNSPQMKQEVNISYLCRCQKEFDTHGFRQVAIESQWNGMNAYYIDFHLCWFLQLLFNDVIDFWFRVLHDTRIDPVRVCPCACVPCACVPCACVLCACVPCTCFACACVVSVTVCVVGDSVSLHSTPEAPPSCNIHVSASSSWRYIGPQLILLDSGAELEK